MLRYYGMGSVIALGGIIAACSNPASPDPPDSNPSSDCPPGSDCNNGYNGYKSSGGTPPPYPPYDAGPDGARCTVGPAIECLILEGQYDISATKASGDETCTPPVTTRKSITSGAFPCPYANDPSAAAGESCSTETDVASCRSTTVCTSTEDGVTKTTTTTFSARTLHQTRSTKRANDAGAPLGPDCNIDLVYWRKQ